MAKDWLTGSMAAGERDDLYAHVRECPACAQKSEQHMVVRSELKSLPFATPPPDLTVRLRAVAARERASRLAAIEAATNKKPFFQFSFGSTWTRLKLQFQDVMRPLAVPLATGVCSAIVLFSMLMPNLTMARNHNQDVPTVLSTGATVKNVAPLGFSGEAVVDLTVDGNGRVVDYAIVSEHGVDKQALRRSLENTLLFTVFTPATTFGQPMAGKIRLTFCNSAIDVRG